MQMTFFVASFVLDLRRQEALRADCLVCIRLTPRPEPKAVAANQKAVQQAADCEQPAAEGVHAGGEDEEMHDVELPESVAVEDVAGAEAAPGSAPHRSLMEFFVVEKYAPFITKPLPSLICVIVVLVLAGVAIRMVFLLEMGMKIPDDVSDVLFWMDVNVRRFRCGRFLMLFPCVRDCGCILLIFRVLC